MRQSLVRLTAALFTLTVLTVSAAEPAIIPVPQKLEAQPGSFTLAADTRIYADPASMDTGEFLAARLRPATGFPLRVSGKTTPDLAPLITDGILLTVDSADASLGAEGYFLTVATNRVIIRAATQAGLFYGAQTLLQLLPPAVFSSNAVAGTDWSAPCVQIQDWPRFPWRGLMLDVSRHFFTKAEVEQLLDAMAVHKLNTFHWHLVDDGGWRIEIKKYPKLTSVGAWRKGVGFDLDPKSTTAYGPDGRYGGFYTQDDIREVVAYAQQRHITIIPEIEMPGHSVAALTAYPEFACAGKHYSTDTAGGVNAGVYSPGKEATFGFLEDVLTEVFGLFPSPYIHIGGDEVPKSNWKHDAACQALMRREGLKNEEELQSYFVKRIEKFVNSKGHKLIGWSEILQGGLAPTATVMDWIGGGKEAASEGHDVIMTPTGYCYFDFYQSSDHAAEPKAMGYGGTLALSKVYSFEPIPSGLAPEARRHILGAQGNVWTELIPNIRHVEYMAFPRLCAMAEVTWSAAAARNFDDFSRRLPVDEQRLDRMGVNYRQATAVKIGGWTPAEITSAGSELSWDVTGQVTAPGQFRVSLNYTQGGCGIDIGWVALLEDGQEVSRDAHAGFTGSNPRQPVYTLTVPAPKPGAHYTVRAQVAGSGGTDSTGEVDWNLKPVKD